MGQLLVFAFIPCISTKNIGKTPLFMILTGFLLTAQRSDHFTHICLLVMDQVSFLFFSFLFSFLNAIECYLSFNSCLFIHCLGGCPGQRLSIFEAKTVLAILLQQFEVSTPDDHKKMNFLQKFVHWPQRGVPLQIKCRANLNCSAA